MKPLTLTLDDTLSAALDRGETIQVKTEGRAIRIIPDERCHRKPYTTPVRDANAPLDEFDIEAANAFPPCLVPEDEL